MNVEELKKSGRIIFECVAGSHLYNLATPQSDTDIRGLYVNPPSEYLGLSEPSGQISDDKNDTTYYSLKRLFELAMSANPNLLELFFVPTECVRTCTPVMRELVKHRHLFISKKCHSSFSGYATAQIKKSRGQNKMVNHPELAVMPKKEDFCKVIPASSFNINNDLKAIGVMPARPIPVANLSDCDLSLYHCAALEHVPDTYRLYYYGDKNPKGVFRGDGMLACESIPVEDECKRFVGLLIYNRNEFEKALKEHQKYLDWITNRNDARWIDQEGGLVNYDAKNMMHCVRLLLSGENILRYGEPLVRFEGEQREYLMRIRRGEIPYDTIMAEVDGKMQGLDELYPTSTIPDSVDHAAIERLYRKLVRWQRVWRFLDLF